MAFSICYTLSSAVTYSVRTEKNTNCFPVNDSLLGTDLHAKLRENSLTLLNVPHNFTSTNYMIHGYGILLSGSPPPEPPSIIISEVTKAPNLNFNSRRGLGEVVTAPYYRSSCVVTAKNRYLVSPDACCNVVGCPSDHTLALHSYNSGYYPFSNRCSGYVEFVGTRSATVESKRYHGTVTNVDSAFTYIDEKKIRQYFTRIYPVNEKFPDLVQRTLADANERSVDLLTSIMEGPETIVSIASTYRSVRKAITSYINGEGLLKHTQFLRRNANRVKLGEARSRLIVLQQELLIARNYQRRKKLLRQINKAQRYIATFPKRESKISAWFADASSSLWLRLRYEILPTLGLIKDLIDSASALSRAYITTRKRAVDGFAYSPEIPGWSFEGSSTVQWNTFCKYGFSIDSDMIDLRKAFSSNVFLTFWEAGRLTFVLDWFFTTGDFLSAKFGKPDLAVTEGITLSSRLTIDGKYIYAADPSLSFEVKFEGYNRVIPELERVLMIFPLIDLNFKRLADSAALLWGDLKRPFRLK